VDRMALDVTDAMAGLQLVPSAVEVFGDQAELDDQDTGEIEGRPLATLFLAKDDARLFHPCP
jgi:hypothetical protein